MADMRTLEGQGSAAFTEQCFKPIGIELLRTPDGTLWAADLWFKDLAYHLEYFPATTLLSPIRAVGDVPCGWQSLDGARFPLLDVLEAPNPRSVQSAIRQLPKMWRQLSVGLKRADIVYCGFVEWPIAYGWLVAPRLMVRRRHLPVFTFLESTFWRPSVGVKFSRRRRLRGFVSEQLTRFGLRRIDLAFVTQPAYGEMVPSGRAEVVEVHASWIERKWIVTDEELSRRLERRSDDSVMRILFAGRLEEEKGLRVLMDAIGSVVEAGIPATFSVVGTGTLVPELNAFAAVHPHAATLIEPVTYGPDFLALIADVDVVVIPSLSSEQPRLVYDAFSQGVPVLAAATTGLLACVPTDAGWMFVPNSADDLVRVITDLVGNREMIAQKARSAVELARRLTHADTHDIRRAAFNVLLGACGETSRPAVVSVDGELDDLLIDA